MKSIYKIYACSGEKVVQGIKCYVESKMLASGMLISFIHPLIHSTNLEHQLCVHVTHRNKNEP